MATKATSDEKARLRLLEVLRTMDEPALHMCDLCHETVARLLGGNIPYHEDECPPPHQDRRIGCAHSTYLREKLMSGLNLLCLYLRTESAQYRAAREKILAMAPVLERLDRDMRSTTTYISDLVHRPDEAMKSRWRVQCPDIEAAKAQKDALAQEHRKLVWELFQIRRLVLWGLENLKLV